MKKTLTVNLGGTVYHITCGYIFAAKKERKK